MIEPRTVSRLLAALLVLGSSAFVAVYVAIALLRIRYPFELEWMEGGIVDGVRRVLAGEPLYVEPSVDFVPYGYPPLYHWTSAAVAAVTGVGFFPLRLVSFVASLGSFALIYGLVKRETGARFAAFLAACLFAATFKASAGWFDVARIDSFGLLLLLGAIWLARFARTAPGAALAGATFYLAFMTKQIALTAAVAVALYYALFQRRLLLPFVVSLGALVLGTTKIMDALYGGWFSYYVFEFQAGRGLDPNMWPVFLRFDLLVLFAAVVFGAVYVARKLRRRDTRAEGVYYLLLGGALTTACGLARSLALGSYPNVSIPMHAFLAVLFGLGAHEIDLWLRARDDLPRARWLRPAFLLVCMLQFARLVYDPSQPVPTARDREAGEALVGRLRAIDGDVFVPCHEWLAAQADKRTWVHAVGIYDQLHQERTRAVLHGSVQHAIEEKRFAAIVLDYDWTAETWFQGAIEANYEVAEHLFDPADSAFRPVTGVWARPDKLYVRRK